MAAPGSHAAVPFFVPRWCRLTKNGFYTGLGAGIRVLHIGELLLLSIYSIACVTTLYPRGGAAVRAARGDCMLTRAEAALTV